MKKNNAYKSIKSYETNKNNPFMIKTVTHIDKGDKFILVGNKKSDLMIDGSTNEVKAHTVMAKRTKIDRAQFVKIYTSTIRGWFDLSKTAMKVFSYIACTIKPNQDQFILIFEECMEFTGYKSKKSIIQGLTELIDNDIIARSKTSVMYFINPSFFFNGDRLTLLQQYDVEEAPDPLDQVGTTPLPPADQDANT